MVNLAGVGLNRPESDGREHKKSTAEYFDVKPYQNSERNNVLEVRFLDI